MTGQVQRILRNYRNMSPTKFHTFNQRVRTALTDKTKIPESVWAANQTLLSSYLASSSKHDTVYHESMLGSRLVIAEREILQAQLVNFLDEIAFLLEMAAVRNPDLLIASGFDMAKEKRGHARAKAIAVAQNAARAEQAGEGSGTPS